MKLLKMLGLFVMAAASLMAFAGSASAQTLTSPTNVAYFGEITESLDPGTSALLKAGFAEITCTSSTVSGKVTTNNSTEASGEITSVSFSNCGSATVDTINNKGTLKVTHGTHVISGTGVEVTTSVAGTSCVYGMGTGTTLGTATNTQYDDEGVFRDRVTTDHSAKLPKVSGGFLCANPATWTANYVITKPTETFAD